MGGARMWRGSAVALAGVLLSTVVAVGQTRSPFPVDSPTPRSGADDTRCEDLGLLDETVSAASLAGVGVATALAQDEASGPMCRLTPWVKAAWPLKSAFPGGFYVADAEGDSADAGT